MEALSLCALMELEMEEGCPLILSLIHIFTFYVDGKATGSFKKPNNANGPFDKDGNEFLSLIHI